MNKSFLKLNVLLMMSLVACNQNEPEFVKDTDLTGNEVTYPLASASDFNISGTATLKERTDNSTEIIISLLMPKANVQSPVHLHYGDVGTDKADIAAVLEPVNGNTGKSKTILKQLANESLVSFGELKTLNGCLKIHLAASGEGRDIILSAGNIGNSVKNEISSGRSLIGTCKSE